MKFLINKLRSATRNYTTTILGIGVILSALGGAIARFFGEGEPPTLEEILAHKETILAGVGLILARDADKSSEQSGAK